MYKIGEFSTLAKTTIKTLRYYEKEKLLIPAFVDNNGYRYYETIQLKELAKIISLRQIGLSIHEIKEVLEGKSLEDILMSRKEKVEEELTNCKYQLSKINYLLEGRDMSYEVILSSGNECLKTNPDIKCIKPDYCYVNYLDGEYKEKDIKIRYAQAVEKEGIPNETIKFMKLNKVEAVCIYHKGAYDLLPDAYSFIMKYIEENGYEIAESPRERYIDGIWNKENIDEWLTEIQVPVRKK